MFARCTALVALLMLFCAAPLPARAADTPAAMTVAKYVDDQDLYRSTHPAVEKKLRVKENYKYYDIQGESAADLRRQMRQNGTKWNDGKVYAALTTWDISYDYDIASENGRYSLASVTTDIDIVFHLPRRLDSVAVSKELSGQWSDYMEHLNVHEMGHRDLAVKSAAHINELLASLGSFGSKGELRSEAERVVKAELKKMKELQVSYDADTHHGEKQGAILPD
ncbi:DUF922 domain-containing protein [Geobacter sp. SVR]|uniref:DUF922 domain-containing protein n=1 Tax=Geobacter sp. SVR TaxID=2495594 RepID=UPI00143F00D7|nr:DUF922 domain-containing protein [Geobacter sp. SVR]BCS53566.1 hypothetical protein GSVR_18740 [Geobacter sp. SVR]GCF84237.1 hypothetical protein GSbR_08370 [Geobacter sp. SVR]